MCLTFDPARTEPKFENRNCVDGAAAQLASDLSAIATSGLSAEHQLLAVL